MPTVAELESQVYRVSRPAGKEEKEREGMKPVVHVAFGSSIRALFQRQVGLPGLEVLVRRVAEGKEHLPCLVGRFHPPRVRKSRPG